MASCRSFRSLGTVAGLRARSYAVAVRRRRRVVLRRRLQIAVGFFLLAMCELFLTSVAVSLAHQVFGNHDPVLAVFAVVFGAGALAGLRFLVGQARLAVIVDHENITVRNWWRTNQMLLTAFDHTNVRGIPPRVDIVQTPTAEHGVTCGALSSMLVFQRKSKAAEWGKRLEAAVAEFLMSDDPQLHSSDHQPVVTPRGE